MTQKGYWFNNRENAIEPLLIKEEYLVDGAKDIGLGYHSNFYCDWRRIYMEAFTILKDLKKN